MLRENTAHMHACMMASLAWSAMHLRQNPSQRAIVHRRAYNAADTIAELCTCELEGHPPSQHLSPSSSVYRHVR